MVVLEWVLVLLIVEVKVIYDGSQSWHIVNIKLLYMIRIERHADLASLGMDHKRRFKQMVNAL